MLLSKIERHIESEEGFFLNIKNGKAFFGEGKDIYKFGSKIYPLGKRAHIFSSDYIEECKDSEGENYKRVARAIENSNWEHKDGYCYQNADILQQTFQAFGIDAKYFSGWLFPTPRHPIHHAWVVVDGNVYDISINMSLQLAMYQQVFDGKNPYDKESVREIKKLKEKHQSLMDDYVWGNPKHMVYIGAESEPNLARAQYRKAIEAVENHPSYQYRGANKYGESRYQKLLSEV